MSGIIGSCNRPKFKSSFLISQQKSLRLRHLSQIAACNLNPVGKCIPIKNIEIEVDSVELERAKYGYFFTLAIETGSTLYTSEFVCDANPSWKRFDLDRLLSPSILSVKGCIVKIWLKDDDMKDILVLSWFVHFSGLVPIGQNLFNISPHMATNTVLFRIKEMLYTSADCRFRKEQPEENKTLIPIYHTMPLPSPEVKTGSRVSSMCRLHSITRSKYLLQMKIDNLIKDMEDFGFSVNSERYILLEKVEKSRLMISVLTERLEREITKLRSLRNNYDQMDVEIQEKSMQIFDQYHAFNRDLSCFQKSEELIGGRIAYLQDIVTKVHHRRIHLLRQLPVTFPITHDPINKDKMYICNIHLPEAEYYGTAKDSTLNVALGFVAQLLVAISNLINIPLAFPITFFGSTSSITDWTTVPTSTSFPLHSRGKEKILFDYAVFLLNKNIAQFRWTCGMPTTNLRPTLFNILTLLNALCDPENPCVIPDVVTKSPLKPISLDAMLGEASLRNSSDNNEETMGKGSWLKDNHSNYSKKYEHWKACRNFNSKKQLFSIHRTCSIGSGLNFLQKRTPSTCFKVLQKRTKSLPGNKKKLEQVDLDDDLIRIPRVSPNELKYIDGLNDTDRKIIDESFELIKKKYFLKRSNSLDRLTTLNTTVAEKKSETTTDIDSSDRINGIDHDDSESENSSESTTEVAIVNSEKLIDEKLHETVTKADPLLEVFNRTNALANQNFSFKYSSKRSDNS